MAVEIPGGSGGGGGETRTGRIQTRIVRLGKGYIDRAGIGRK